MRSLRYTLAFLLLALAFLGTAWGLLEAWTGLALVFAYAALSFLGMSLAYGGIGPAIFRKSSTGRLPLSTWVLLAPFLVLTRGSWYLARCFPRGQALGELLPGLFLGRRLTEREAREAAKRGWMGVLDLAGEFDEVPALRSLPHYRSLPILDATAPTPEEFALALRWLRETTALGPVYVHCAEGHGRTGTVLLAYLLSLGEVDSIASGLARLRAVRPALRLNREQRKALTVAMQRGMTVPPPTA